jgi:hypothetical protein
MFHKAAEDARSENGRLAKDIYSRLDMGRTSVRIGAGRSDTPSRFTGGGAKTGVGEKKPSCGPSPQDNSVEDVDPIGIEAEPGYFIILRSDEIPGQASSGCATETSAASSA